MNLLKNRPAYQMLIVLNSMQEFQVDDYKPLNKLSFFDFEKCFSGITREDFFIGFACTWQNVLDRLEEYQFLATIKQFELKVHYCNPFKSQIEGYNSDSTNVHFYDRCVKQKLLNEELKIIEDLNSFAFWNELKVEQLKRFVETNKINSPIVGLPKRPVLLMA